MKPALSVLLLAFVITAHAIDYKGALQNARTVYHADGTYTESVQDTMIHEQNEVTYSAQKVVIARKKYALNDKGQPLHGNIYDGRGELKARAQFLYDSFDRLTEQRMMNLQGEVYQRIVFGYDSRGNPLTPKSETYNVKAPNMKSAPIDFTQQREAPLPLDRSQGGAPVPQGNVPYLPEPTPSATGLAPIKPDAQGNYPPADAAQSEGEKKKGFFGKLFGGGKKKEEKK